MRNLSYELKNKSIDINKLEKYGFVKQDNGYVYNTKILDEQFEMSVSFSKDTNTSKLIDIFSGEEYVLVDVEATTRRVCW